MARLTREGAATASPYELEISLPNLIAELKLRPLSSEQKLEVRTKLGQAIGIWLQESGGAWARNISDPDDQPERPLTTQDLSRTLRLLAVQLENIGNIAGVADGGLQDRINTELACALVDVLAIHLEVGSVDGAWEILKTFSQDAYRISHAARIGAQFVQGTSTPRGRKRQHWFKPFYDAVEFVCQLNGIKPTVSTDRITGERRGRFLKVAQGLQRLLPTDMRAMADEALVKRLARGKRRAQTKRGAPG